MSTDENVCAEAVAPAVAVEAAAAAAPQKPTGAKKAPKPKAVELKNAKGTRDFGPFEMRIREKVFQIITDTYKRHGAVQIDTPVFELKSLLLGQYGEDSKLIYDLADQGGEILALRYDLTVPFARYLAMNRNIKNIKRFQIAKVYRRDNPQIQRGRLREFYQCDFDIAGDFNAPMVPDAEVLSIADEALRKLELGPFTIKVNHRKLLTAALGMAGVPEDLHHTACSSIDKLDKQSKAEVQKELEQKGVTAEAVQKFYLMVDTVTQESSMQVALDKLRDILASTTGVDAEAAAAWTAPLEELVLLEKYLQALGVTSVKFELSLARGLDYYTGLIFEAVLEGALVGSIAGGGRYDNLVGKFSPRNNIPCVGFSLGVERIFSILEAKVKKNAEAELAATQVYVISNSKESITDRMAISSKLWAAGINTEFSHRANPKLLDQFGHCEKNGIPLAVIYGDAEKENKVIKIRNVSTRVETTVPFEDLVSELTKAIQSLEL